MQFNDVIGQEAIKNRLIQGVREGRVSHAQLFCGPEGVGKLALALAYAQYINCPHRTGTDSCGECPSCRKYKKLIHPDLHFVFPVVKTPKFKEAVSDHYLDKWRERVLASPYFSLNDWYKTIDVDNAQGQIYVNESNEIIRKLNLKTFEAEYKVMIIWMVERMNVQCANKLLKMIEEPPPKTLFILITEEEEQILSTILSRTQLIKFKAIDAASMTRALERHPDMAGKNLSGIVHLASGNFITAQNLMMPDEDTKFFFNQFTNIMRITYGRSWMALFDWVEEMSALGREKQKSFLLYAMRMFRENFMMNLKEPEIVYLNDNEKTFSERFSPFINERNILVFFEEFEKAWRDIAQNGNPKLVFLDLSLKITKMIKA